MHPTTIGLDIAKHVFQVHGVNTAGKVIIRKKLRRAELKAFFEKLAPCLVGMEACGTAHYWGRELEALGHDVRLMPAAYVKPTSKEGRMTRSMQKRSARPLPGRRCGSSRLRALNNNRS